MKRALTASQPQFLRISWEVTDPENGTVTSTVEADLCLRHRQEIARQHASARGTGRLCDSCDLCEGRQPRRAAP